MDVSRCYLTNGDHTISDRFLWKDTFTSKTGFLQGVSGTFQLKKILAFDSGYSALFRSPDSSNGNNL